MVKKAQKDVLAAKKSKSDVFLLSATPYPFGIKKGMKTTTTSSKKADENHRCKSCGFTFSRKAGLKRHNCYKKLKIHNVMFSLYSCHECQVAYPSKNQLTAHISGHQKDGPESKRGRKFDIGLTALRKSTRYLRDRDSDVTLHKCQECGVTYADQISLMQHTMTHGDGKRSYQCERCGITLAGLDSLRGHMLVHQFDKPHKCTECDSAFVRKFSLTRHVSSIHPLNKRQLRQVCGQLA